MSLCNSLGETYSLACYTVPENTCVAGGGGMGEVRRGCIQPGLCMFLVNLAFTNFCMIYYYMKFIRFCKVLLKEHSYSSFIAM